MDASLLTLTVAHSSGLPNAALSGRGERMRASGPLQRDGFDASWLWCEARTRHAVATIHSITLLVRTRMDSGIVRPSALAVFKSVTYCSVFTIDHHSLPLA